jgi:hypothetical protein
LGEKFLLAENVEEYYQSHSIQRNLMKQFKPDESDLDHLRQDALRLTRIESAILTEGGKEILAVIKEAKERVIDDFAVRDISTFNEAMIIAWAFSIRGKLQILKDLIRNIGDSSIERERIMRELAQYDIPSKGEK